jgi:hypothetical protein
MPPTPENQFPGKSSLVPKLAPNRHTGLPGKAGKTGIFD